MLDDLEASEVLVDFPHQGDGFPKSAMVSRRLMAWLTAGCEMPSRTAALLVLPAFMTALNTSISRICITCTY